jgi:predicted transcriptional regulator
LAKQDWFWDFNAVFDSDLRAFAKLVRLCLACRTNEDRSHWLSYECIAKDCGISRSEVRKAVKELEERGWLERFVLTQHSDAGKHRVTIYGLCEPTKEGV